MTTPIKSSLHAIAPVWTPAIFAETRAAYSSAPAPSGLGVVPIFGILARGESYAHTNYDAIRAAVNRMVKDPSVKTIQLVIDSPGGSINGLPEAAKTIADAARVKPVSAYIPGLGASAAYWLASQASTITAAPSAEIGSVGVLDAHADLSGALAQAGIKPTVVTAGKFKAERSPFQPLTDDARAHMQASVDEWYQQFLGAIRAGRGPRVSHTSTYGDGRLLTAKQALAAGMIDFIGDIR